MTMRKLAILFFSCLAVSLAGCTSGRVRQYENNVQYFRGESRNLFDAARLRHLEQISPEELKSPNIFLAIIFQPPDERKDSIHIEWSEEQFNQYLLEFCIGDSVTPKEKPLWTSEDDKEMEQEMDFDFAVHYARYALPKELLERIRKAESNAEEVELFLKNQSTGERSQPLPWQQVKTWEQAKNN